MIEVKHLTKRYGSHTAVSDLSFTIEKGVIYGFLGPNGAGKSTTMNILTGCLGATDGEVKIAGYDIAEEPLKAKKHIGYLPEQPPVYMDMTPREYLKFVMEVKAVPRKEREEQLQSVMDKTKIFDVQDRLIRNLSKGYRQRVGIAQALLGNPEIIILDEPTVGLDPMQIIEIRELIRELGKDHTIILSSHILSEVQAVCDAIMIISKGKLVASDTAENLTSLFAGETTLHLCVRGEETSVCQVLSQVENIASNKIEKTSDGECLVTLTTVADVDIREALFRAFAQHDLPILEMRREKMTLEDVFLELTQPNGDEAGETLAVPLGEEAPQEEGENA